jgi:hypothetical protein
MELPSLGGKGLFGRGRSFGGAMRERRAILSQARDSRISGGSFDLWKEPAFAFRASAFTLASGSSPPCPRLPSPRQNYGLAALRSALGAKAKPNPPFAQFAATSPSAARAKARGGRSKAAERGPRAVHAEKSRRPRRRDGPAAPRAGRTCPRRAVHDARKLFRPTAPEKPGRPARGWHQPIADESPQRKSPLEGASVQN